ncbi:branched-chain amino acid ABC transporter permease [uncultured Aurantimicrobium sp.]|uniref:branched-chain amino acid ABC transporter permease n=1 Tax=uncultured Aurantimicrobium sp. TaxID=1705357 RepID=UPI0026020EBC|nr:branched-chain amino acid ABC transporter permease [uncultured Aurantimicrobium sp.]
MLTTALSGIGPGGYYAVIAVLLVLMAQLTRVVNFSQVAFGMFGAYISVALMSGQFQQSIKIGIKLPQVVAVVIGILVAGLISALVGWIIAQWLPEATGTARSAVTVATLLSLISIAYILFGSRPQPFKPIIFGPLMELPGGIVITKISVFSISLAVVVAIIAKIVLSKTMLGVRLRAIADRQTAAELLGVNVKLMNVAVWFFTGAVSGLLIVFIAPTQSSDIFTLSMLVVPGAAAALIGAFKNIWAGLIGGILLGVVQGFFAGLPDLIYIRDWIPIIVIIVFLLWNQRKEVWDVAR